MWIGVAMERGSTRVLRVFDGTPAHRAGVVQGDEIAEVDGHAVANVDEFRREVNVPRVGARARFTVRRGGGTRMIVIELTERPARNQLAISQLLNHPAPDFAVAAIAGHGLPGASRAADGSTLSVAALRGKIVLIDFWATWCGPCAVTTPKLVAFAAAHPEIAVLGLSADDADSPISQYAGTHAIPYALARDVDGNVARDYFVEGLPEVVLIDPGGTVRFIGSGIAGVDQLDAELAKL